MQPIFLKDEGGNWLTYSRPMAAYVYSMYNVSILLVYFILVVI